MKKETEIKIELDRPEFDRLAKGQNDPKLERTFGYFKDDFSNTRDGIFPRIKYIEGVKGDKIVFTVKKRQVENDRFFEREEAEVEMDGRKNLDDLREIIKRLGFSREIIFEKRRRVISKKDIVISLDELPFGLFVELEGEPAAIEKHIKELGLSDKPRLTKAYLGLWEDYRDKHGIKESDCVF